MGAPEITGDTTGAVTEGTGDIVTGDLDDTGFFSGNNDDVWSVSVGATYGVATIDPVTGIWSYDLTDTNPVVKALDAGEMLDDTFTVLVEDEDGGTDTQVVTITIAGVPCFVRETRIETDRGPVVVEDLRAGDLVCTLDNSVQPIRWIGSRRLDAAQLRTNARLRPIRIRAGALGQGLPTADLRVSPQHRVLVNSRVSERFFGNRQVLIAAIKPVDLPGIDFENGLTEILYFHLMFDPHEIVTSEGAPTESLLCAPQALRSISREAHDEIADLFPEILEEAFTPVSARPIVEYGVHIREFTRLLAANGGTVLHVPL
ncbi:MAG: calcium-binding protein [Litoreibacter sp.]|nr:calcium-binding protein [Litoreibacter sp.]